ncbi:MAG: phosphoribosylformylglycinamidine synthase subunit PurQ [Thermomicrobiales bacterium]
MDGIRSVAVVTFPGSNGDHDALHSLSEDLGFESHLVDYRATNLDAYDAVILPGGFSYGDALRAGAIARFSPIMPAIREFAAGGKPVLGICNGFQVLCEAHLLPGALLRNKSLQFHCFWTHIRIENVESSWTRDLAEGVLLRLPVAHGEGAYFTDAAGLAELESNGQIVARYANRQGEIDDASNPNGSLAGIAAISNVAGNVVGLMPHPERATNSLVGGEDGRRILQHIANVATGSITVFV